MTHAGSTSKQLGRGLALAVVLSALALFAAVPADAAEFHPYEFSIDGTGSTAGQFGDLETLAVEQSTGTVYGFDRTKVVIDKFDAAGNPQNFSATGTSSLDVAATCPGFSMYQYGVEEIAADSSGTANQGNIYLASESGGGVCAWNAAGEFLWHLTPAEDPKIGGACGVTTDSLGRLWVGSAGNGAMRYTATGSPPSLVLIAGDGNSCKFAIGTGGKIYIAGGYGSGIERWTVNGFEKKLTESGYDVTFDPANEHLFVTSGNHFDEVTTEGEHISTTGIGVPFDQTGVGTLTNTTTIEARSSTGQVYVADRGADRIKVYGPLGIYPDVTTGNASNVTRTGATVGGQLAAAGGSVTNCHYEWGATTSYGNSTPCDQPTPISGATAATASLTGLTPGATYHYRLVAANATGPNWGADKQFTTPFVNGVTTGSATSIARTGATLNGALKPDGIDAHYYFEWGLDESYGNTTPTPPGTDAGSGAASVPASASISGLTYNTTYHYRLVASNPEGTTYGADQTFTTMDAVIDLATESATGISQSSATLNGSLDPDGIPTTYFFEWGETTSYGNVTAVPPGDDAGSTAGVKPVSSPISGLHSYQTYHYRLVAANSIGTSYGEDEAVTTLPPLLPTVDDTAVDGITGDSATVTATVNPGFGETVYRVQYGRDASYGSRTLASDPLDPDDVGHPVSIDLNGLGMGVTYHLRVVAINLAGVTHGPDRTFTTQSSPRITSSAAGSVAETSARIDVAINPGLSSTTFHIEYGKPGKPYESTAESSVIGSDGIDHSASTTITGLTPGTTYQFKVIAKNSVATTTGELVSFQTASPPPLPQGEQPATRCRKGFVVRHGKCVRRHRRKKRRHSRRDRSAHVREAANR